MKNALNPWLDFCRATAIIMVILSHGRRFLMPVFPEAQNLKFGGFLGVELFFVLSGFLIGRIIFDKVKESETSFGWIPSFWFRRWMRTYPSYIIFLIFNLLIIHTIRPDVLPNLFKFTTFTQSLITPHPSFFGEAWSLAVEEVFYFLFPIVISVFLSISKNKKQSIIYAIVVMITISLSLRINAAVNTNLTFNAIRSTSLYRLDSLMIGVIFYYLFSNGKLKKIAKWGVILIPLSVYIASKPDAYMDESVFLKIFFFDIANIGCACLITSLYSVNIYPLAQTITSKIARWSYAAYLTNLPVIYFITYYISTPTSVLGCLSQWVLFVTMTLLSARLVYNFFEFKVLQFRDSIRSS